MDEAQIYQRLHEVLESVFCPVAGCWGLHGARCVPYYDEDSECHVLEVWPYGFREPESEPQGNGKKPDLLYELAAFDFLALVEDVYLTHFHFSQERKVFEICWEEDGTEVELRLHIEPAEDDDGSEGS